MYNTVSEITQFWGQALKEIEKRVGERKVFESFFMDSYIHEIRGNTVVLAVDGVFAASIIKTKYFDTVLSVINEISGNNYELEVVLSKDLEGEKTSNEHEASRQSKQEFFSGAVINPNLTFDNFVVGSFNKEASQAALLVASNPGKMFNPLFIYSHSGLGKTHLLHAIGNYVKKEIDPNAKIMYMEAHTFVEEYVKFVRADADSNNLADALKGVDVLLFDDVQFLVDKVKTEEMFFYIYTNLANNNKQIVITSDRQPNELNKLQERLVTRFNQGLVVKIDEPDQISCVEILRKKIQSRGLDVNRFDENVLYFFADRFSKNVRELEGALNRLIFIVSMRNPEKITMEIAVDAVSSVVGSKQLETQLSEQKIINVVADYYNLAPSQLTGKIRTGQIALARHIAMYLIRNMLDVPLKKIGDMFGGKDHTTVMSGISKVDKELKTNEALREAVEDIQKRLKV